jgi:XRE family aerobic/anaerobic benzoate catabolism transcriptional regulator
MAARRSAKIPPCDAEHLAPAAELDAGGYLRRLGERVRNARARHGMTRKMLAHDSDVSERYLAELEGGRGNLSIALLRRIAAALGVPLENLVAENEPPIEYALLAERLRRLSPAEMAEADAILAERFGPGRGRLRRIALIGVRGAGKSTLGPMLAERLGWSFVELSREIEREAGAPVEQIFARFGQAGYRRYERRAIERLIRERAQIVIAAGGGLGAEPAAFETLRDGCLTIWLVASPEDHWERVVRQAGEERVRGGAGDAEAMANLRRILEQRAPMYSKADARLDTTGRTPAESLEDLSRIVQAAERDGACT